jgi:hypothetical protein
MRRTTIALGMLAMASIPALAGPVPQPPAKVPAGFEKLKGLVGEWEGKIGESGSSARVSYRLMSSGSALVETLNTPDGTDMITVYHPDGDRVMVTHYCASKNQPRMRTESGGGEPNRIVFKYLDVTNFENSTEGVMTGLTVTFEDADHFSQTWTFADKPGGTGKNETFRYTRKK